MKSLRSLAVALVVGAGTYSTTQPMQLHAGDILAGAATGIVARLGSYALKDQGKMKDDQALMGAAFFTLLSTGAYQSVINHGSFRRGLVQLTAAAASYIVTMYIVRTQEKEAKPEVAAPAPY